jgi:thiosulfate/3-mercaptopyruvate sulfurtransferase
MLVGCAALVAACSLQDRPTAESADAATAMDTLVTAEWLSEQIDAPDLVVLDCTVLVEPTADGTFRTTSGKAGYDAGHIPGAGFADLTRGLSDAGSRLDFAMPSPEQFAAAMSALGVGDDTRVVLYDRGGSVWAARVWWMLRWIGFDRAALLDGGLNAWAASGYALSTASPGRAAKTLSIRLRPELIADRDEVLAAIDDAKVDIIDALPPDHYRGEMSMYQRPGHIATAVNVPVFSVLDEAGRYRPAEELETLFAGDRSQRKITYCGGGIAASANAYVMTRLGFTDVAVYAASLQEWAADPALPMDVSLEFDEDDE